MPTTKKRPTKHQHRKTWSREELLRNLLVTEITRHLPYDLRLENNMDRLVAIIDADEPDWRRKNLSFIAATAIETFILVMDVGLDKLCDENSRRRYWRRLANKRAREAKENKRAAKAANRAAKAA